MRMMFVGAHPDDIELLVGGTLLKAKDEGHDVTVIVCTNGQIRKGNRTEEQLDSIVAMKVCGRLLHYEDGALKNDAQLVSSIDECVRDFRPDVVFTHCPEDYHNDHVVVSKAVKAANRGGRFNLVYFAPYDLTINFEANMFVDITNYIYRKKILLDNFESQKDRWYFNLKRIHHGTAFSDCVERFRIDFIKL